MIDNNTIDQIIQIPVSDILDYYHIPYKLEGREFVCCCPFHNEKTPSFKISKGKKGKNGGDIWACFGCGKSGSGAVSFVAEMEGLERRGKDYFTALYKTAQIGGISIDEKEKNSLRPAAKIEWVAAQEHYTFSKRSKFKKHELEALGCRCTEVLEDYTDNSGQHLKRVKTDSNGDPVYRYSFSTPYNNFNACSIAEDFQLYAVDYYIAPVKRDKGHSSSMKISSNKDFPIFVFMYDNESWGRIYQPYGDYRFITWPNDDHPSISTAIFGDTYLMKAFSGEDMKLLAIQSPSHINEGMHTINITNESNGKTESVTKFDDIILCSGGSDAINTYYHSNAHVCFMGSEKILFNKEFYRKIDRAGKNIYVMFDLDDTGKRSALDIALRYLRFHIIFLPEELKSIRVNGGKKGKDAKDYFSYYRPIDKEMGIREHFRILMQNSRSLKFWERKEKTDSKGNVNVSYEIDSGSVLLFLNAMGIWTYTDPEDKQEKKKKFIRLIDEHKVEVISRDNIQSEVSSMMINYLKNTFHYDTKLENKILDSPRISESSLQKLPSMELSLDSWGKDFDYVFCQNKAFRISAEEIKPIDYQHLPYHVYINNICPFNITLNNGRTFDILVNPQYQEMKKTLDEMIAKKMPQIEIKKKENELSEFGVLNRFILQWNIPFEEQPHYIQVLYNTGRMHWRKEERGIPLTEEEKKEQDAHFINKVAAIGYLLFRYKDASKPWALYAMEDRVEKEGRSNGGSFKSGLFKLQANIRGYFEVDGRNFEPSRGAINYFGVTKRETSIIHVEDIEKGDIFYHFYNRITSGGSARNLNEPENQYSYYYWPKMCMTSNYPINLSDQSTARRIWVLAMSDYYHTKSPSGDMQERTPYTEFKHNLMQDNPSEKEVNEFFNASLQFMQFYMQVKEKIEPPMKNVSRRVLMDKLKPEVVFFFDEYFGNPKHRNRGVSCNEILFHLKDFVGYSASAQEKLSKKALKEKLEFYCRFEGLLFNPEGFLKTQSDFVRGERRMAVWVTAEREEMQDGARVKVRRRIMSSPQEPCWYIGNPEVDVKIVPDDKENDYDPLPLDEENGPREIKDELPF